MQTATAKLQINRAWFETRRQLEIQLGRHIIQAKSLLAGGAGEMRVLVLRGDGRRRIIDLESPHPVVPGDAMGNADQHQPLQHPIHRDPINRMVRGQRLRHIQVRSGVIEREQTSQHRHARLRQSIRSAADGRLGFGDA